MTEFDYVIVGGGTAGCVLARRLTDDGRHRVLLLEAGGSDDRFFIRMPIGYGKCFHDERVNWRYLTEPEASLAGRRGYWPRGRVLGGSGSINAMVYVRGHPDDYDGWAAQGNPGWAWRDVLPYFRRLEDAPHGASEWRGSGGPFAVSDIRSQAHPLCGAFLRAGAELGWSRHDGFNDGQHEGVGLYEIAVRGGRRVSSATAYLAPARQRPNLAVVTDAQATAIGFDGTRARWVAYRLGGESRRARASREILVCSGAINSPQLLQLSGIGPAPLLRSLGVPLVHDLPAAGGYLQDHLCIDYVFRASVPSLNEVLRPWPGRLRAGLRYLVHRDGPLAMSVNQAGGFVRTRGELDRPDVQLYFSPLSYTRPTPGKRALMLPDPHPGFLLSAQPCRPASRGRVDIASRDPFAPPKIDPHSLEAPRDLDELAAGARLLRRLAAAPSLAAVIAEELVPGPRVRDDDDRALRDDIRQRASTVFHPVGTCRMGPDPRTSVVDARLRVHGIAGLRVVDASIFPAITSGNTHAPVLMVAERAADLVLEDAA